MECRGSYAYRLASANRDAYEPWARQSPVGCTRGTPPRSGRPPPPCSITGCPASSRIAVAATRAWLAGVALPPASRQLLGVALRQIDGLDAELDPIDQWLRTLVRHQPSCRALIVIHDHRDLGSTRLTAPVAQAAGPSGTPPSTRAPIAPGRLRGGRQGLSEPSCLPTRTSRSRAMSTLRTLQTDNGAKGARGSLGIH